MHFSCYHYLQVLRVLRIGLSVEDYSEKRENGKTGAIIRQIISSLSSVFRILENESAYKDI